LYTGSTKAGVVRTCVQRTGRGCPGKGTGSSQRAWHGVEGFLPTDDDALLLTRAWLAWVELWRSEEWLEYTVSMLRAKELALLAETHEYRLSRPDLDLVGALLEGLRSAICAPSRPMTPDRARAILRDASATALGRSA
jgi:hypothetical protein